jgi:hypothetical protein
MPGEPLECGCVGGGLGVQLCNATGTGFDLCNGCPAVTVPDMSTAADASAPGADMPGGDGMDDGMADAMADPNQATMGDDPNMPAEDMSSMPDAGPSAAGAVPGTSCGVGLPALCELEQEKCCARSLQTDTCIGAAEPCTCDLPDCTTMEATCDGPEDCPDGQVCCGTFQVVGGGATYVSFACSATACDFFGSQREACHQDETECAPDLVCANSQLLTNVQVCIDAASIEQ